MRTPRRPDIRTEIKPQSPSPARAAGVSFPVASQLPPIADAPKASAVEAPSPAPSAVPGTAPLREDNDAGTLMDVLTRSDAETVPLGKDKFKIS
jgi:hypothetical protein